MWISKKIIGSEAAGAPGAETGTVTTGGVSVNARSGREYRNASAVFPFGFVSVIPGGASAAFIDSANLCLGVITGEAEGLEAGEVCIFSLGGAKILLKNSGEVVINGQSFAAEGALNG